MHFLTIDDTVLIDVGIGGILGKCGLEFGDGDHSVLVRVDLKAVSGCRRVQGCPEDGESRFECSTYFLNK